MVGVEHVAGFYLANPPGDGSPVMGMVILAILAAAVTYGWSREVLAHR